MTTRTAGCVIACTRAPRTSTSVLRPRPPVVGVAPAAPLAVIPAARRAALPAALPTAQPAAPRVGRPAAIPEAPPAALPAVPAGAPAQAGAPLRSMARCSWTRTHGPVFQA